MSKERRDKDGFHGTRFQVNFATQSLFWFLSFPFSCSSAHSLTVHLLTMPFIHSFRSNHSAGAPSSRSLMRGGCKVEPPCLWLVTIFMNYGIMQSAGREDRMMGQPIELRLIVPDLPSSSACTYSSNLLMPYRVRYSSYPPLTQIKIQKFTILRTLLKVLQRKRIWTQTVLFQTLLSVITSLCRSNHKAVILGFGCFLPLLLVLQRIALLHQFSFTLWWKDTFHDSHFYRWVDWDLQRSHDWF